MPICSCGNVAEENGAKCARCNALQALELKTGASTEEIHNSFEVLSKAWNPDRFQSDGALKAVAEEKLKAIAEAFSLLTRGSVQTERFHSQEARASQVAITGSAPALETAKQGGKTQNLEFTDGEIKRSRIPMPLLIGCGVLLSALLTGWFLFKPLDAALMGIPVAGGVYADFKADIRSGIQELKNKVGPSATVGAPTAGETASSPVQSQQMQKTDKATTIAHRQAAQPSGATQQASRQTNENHLEEGRALPLITAGLNESEVIAAQGAPTSESSDELDYGNSKLYFSDGVLYGWRIDPSSPLRVKLWPTASVDPNLQSFGMGSTKNEVIVVQGTPTTFSPTIFGYGKSEVYFQDGHVVGWKNDPATPLRTTSR
jgi:hypothetical protein